LRSVHLNGPAFWLGHLGEFGIVQFGLLVDLPKWMWIVLGEVARAMFSVHYAQKCEGSSYPCVSGSFGSSSGEPNRQCVVLGTRGGLLAWHIVGQPVLEWRLVVHRWFLSLHDLDW